MSEFLADDFLFSGLNVDDETMFVFDKPTQNNDGIYRPNLKDAIDKKIGYRATLRFLPNVLKNGNVGPFAIKKHVHYVNMKNETNLSGYYDCRRNYDSYCELCAEFWKLEKSKNAADNEKAKLIMRTTKYYSYILVLEDEQNPELVGKIMIYPYGHTIKEKINSERQGEVTGTRCNVFDFAKGKDFKLIIKEKGGFQNYESSSFLDVSPIKLYDEASKTFKTAPIDNEGLISNPKVQAKIKEFLLSRTVDLEDFKAKEWDDVIQNKVTQIISILNGKDVFVAEQSIKKSKNDSSKKQINEEKDTSFESDVTDADDFFSLDDE